jgi:hypothetical protein
LLVPLVTLCATCFVGAAACALASTGAYFVLLSVASTLLLAQISFVQLAVMSSVPHQHRTLALGLLQIFMHAFGDVPAPPIIGALTDRLSPLQCPDGDADDGGAACTRSARGLQETLFLVYAWLAWPMLLWAVAAAKARVDVKKLERAGGCGGQLTGSPASSVSTGAGLSGGSGMDSDIIGLVGSGGPSVNGDEPRVGTSYASALAPA